ncbi:FAD-binding protein [Novosphingobium olei]|uniref:FAD-binding protein n=1 Tax=Novosphingobium olei TaxID=2728851 RepID=A0A7Y0BLW9_9SPHN|nr:FAD-binding protein [Novosphingobium olei]NML92236.1 FAD-binding protein [Novosphingobium olei]
MIASSFLRADVLVVGGGMAAAWAAIGAARQGVSVIVIDKGAMGTSGVTATGGPGHWWVPPDRAAREAAIARQMDKAQGLAERAWMERILDLTWRHLPEIAPFYPFGSNGAGGPYVQGVRGPEYMRALRKLAIAHGVTILDHHPAIELLRDEDGRIAGVHAVALASGDVIEIRSGATILATGGCAFRSGLIGSHTQTGDGYLMAAEAGASLSGMEFSISYSLSPAWASTRTLPYFAARFFDEAGRELDIPPPDAGHSHLQALGRAMLEGPVLADLSDAPPVLEGLLRRIQPLTAAAFDRRGIDLFRQRFAVRLYGEGTIRGTGGIRIVDRDCRTEVPGLFAAGDAATRELVAGASSGGGAVNSAWALSSGLIAGEAAAGEAIIGRQRPAAVRGLGRAGFHPRRGTRAIDRAGAISTVRDRVLSYDRAFWRTRETLESAGHDLESVWTEVADHASGEGRDLVELREIAAMAATARWCNAAALARDETRGLAVRADRPDKDGALGHRLLARGLSQVEVIAEAPVQPREPQPVAA